MHSRSRIFTSRVGFVSSTHPLNINCHHRIAPSPLLLFTHFFAVAFYSIWVMFTHPREARSVSSSTPDSKLASLQLPPPGIEEYPWLVVKSFRVVCLYKITFCMLDYNGFLVLDRLRRFRPIDVVWTEILVTDNILNIIHLPVNIARHSLIVNLHRT